MRWSARIGLMCALLLVTAIGLPVLFPPDTDYEYVVRPADGSERSVDKGPISYQNLSQAEQAVFDAARAEDGSTRREEQVNGSHYTHYHDQARSVTVNYSERTYEVRGRILRENFGILYWGRPLLSLLGIVSGVVALLTFVAETVRDR